MGIRRQGAPTMTRSELERLSALLGKLSASAILDDEPAVQEQVGYWICIHSLAAPAANDFPKIGRAGHEADRPPDRRV
jgi:hypothetical protein